MNTYVAHNLLNKRPLSLISGITKLSLIQIQSEKLWLFYYTHFYMRFLLDKLQIEIKGRKFRLWFEIWCSNFATEFHELNPWSMDHFKGHKRISRPCKLLYIMCINSVSKFLDFIKMLFRISFSQFWSSLGRPKKISCTPLSLGKYSLWFYNINSRISTRI